MFKSAFQTILSNPENGLFYRVENIAYILTVFLGFLGNFMGQVDQISE